MTTDNVVNLEDSIIASIENVILASLSNRAGKWVAPHVMVNAAETTMVPNVNVHSVIAGMVQDGRLEKSSHTAYDKFNQPFELPLYRLTPTNWL
jgi:hypothetical protein